MKLNLLWDYPAHIIATTIKNARTGGLKKLGAGFKQLHADVSANSQTAQGYAMIADGFRHILGTSKQQLHDKRVASYLTTVDDKWYKTVKALVENVISSQDYGDRPNPHLDMICKLTVAAFGKLIATTLVGVQPMHGPVSMNYRMEFIDRKDDSENRICLEILKDTVVAMSRKLQARWTPEAMQDIMAAHGIDLEAEMMDALATTIADELNVDLLTTLNKVATVVPVEVDFNTITPDHMALIIQTQANEISKGTRRGPGNWVIVSQRVLELLKASSIFVEETGGATGNFTQVGTLLKHLKVYTYAFSTTDVLIGFKGGTGEMDAGLFFNPYVMVISSGVIVDPRTFNPIVSFMTRYGYTSAPNVSAYYVTLNFEKDEEAPE